jgi:nucleoside-diphosphate-sugar epimerase
MPGSRVLVTGMSGLIGGALRKRLEGRYPLRALNRRDLPGVECHRGDIADLDAIQPAFRDVEIVVHLAAAAGGAVPWERIERDNLRGTYNVFEAARRAGVRRVIFASSGATVTGYERDEPYAALVAGTYDGLTAWPMLTHEAPVRPAALYGVSKVYGEALGRQYSDEHDLSVLSIRIGRVKSEDRPGTARDFAVWLSQRDVVQILERAITAPAGLRHGIFFATSDNRWGYRDLRHARETLGFVPEDRAEDHR